MLSPMSAVQDSSVSLAAVAGPNGIAKAGSCQRRKELEKILSQSLPRFRSIALRSLRNPDDAEDAVQEAMLSALKHIGQFDGRAQLSTWLTTIVINAARMEVRRRVRHPMQAIDEAQKEGQLPITELLHDPRPSPEQTLEQSEQRKLLDKLITCLPRSQQATLRLHQQDDFSIKMASEKLGMPQGTVKAQLTRGRAKIRERLRKMSVARKARTWSSDSKAKREERLSSYRRDFPQGAAHLPITAFKQGGYEGWTA